jgi:hypothetical protein
MKRDMNAIRNELCEFIRIADEKKINALYELLEQDIEAKKGWWLDTNIVEELEDRYNALESGIDKGVSLDEMTESIAEKRKKKYGG